MGSLILGNCHLKPQYLGSRTFKVRASSKYWASFFVYKCFLNSVQSPVEAPVFALEANLLLEELAGVIMPHPLPCSAHALQDVTVEAQLDHLALRVTSVRTDEALIFRS